MFALVRRVGLEKKRCHQEVGEQDSDGSWKPLEGFQDVEWSVTDHKNNLGSFFKNMEPISLESLVVGLRRLACGV